MLDDSTTPIGSPKHRSLLDGIIQFIGGTDTASMTPEEGAKVEAQRKRDGAKAANESASFANDPEAAASSFMGAPGASGGGGVGLGDVFHAIGSLFGGKGKIGLK